MRHTQVVWDQTHNNKQIVQDQTCDISGEFDHIEHFQFLQHGTGTTFQVGEDKHIPKTWMLLDNQLTVDVFHNADLLKNILESSTIMDIDCNAGVTSTNMVGDLMGYGTVRYHPNGIANILLLACMEERGYHVTYDSRKSNEFKVHKPDGTVRTFSQLAWGHFYMESRDGAGGITLINTVANNCSSSSNCNYSQAVLAWQVQKIMGQPSTRAFMDIVERNLLPNCPITKQDIAAAEHILVWTSGC